MTLTTVPERSGLDSRPAAGTPARRRRRPGLTGWAYAAPTALFVLIFFVTPILLVGRMSVSDWGLFAGNRGLNAPENFIDVAEYRLFWPAVWFTVKYTVLTTVILLGLALLMALIVQESSRWTGFLRTSFLVPSALGLASASLLFYALYSPQSSPFGFLGVSFLGTPTAALWSTVVLIVWRFAGFYMLLLLVGLQGISADVYEAARLDGAGRWQTFRYVTLPLLRSSIALCTILCVTGSMLGFDQFYLLTKGGPDNSTLTIVQLIYNFAFFGGNNLGRAAALSIMVLAALLIANVLQFRGLRGKEG
ncbi:carbohydrate ABC transporter permease [Actinoplanes xinjiangensis]|uniref:Carbohydrate ABC transporter membrane protein 1 (CUT1 family) n=1 Tax=Actinoplanes xinjiangensis TaxID=512350 RepID=A0A316FFV2_9ACTN|nr:sugar ABC transporter permease [Actinoplanes xinjiangensis]PWK47694.1 carbohydrate ABC transporter membrane protein 1 (CUT1 family) [Actinoplanes xinjiangensis]GIF39375.1 sugar ABC transporter permease [Actinoplanes xinjiangensis]